MSNPVPGDTAPAQDPDGRCDIQFENGHACTKTAGHWTPSTQDPHTPECAEPPAPGVTVLESPDPAPAQPDCTCGSDDNTHDSGCATVTRWYAEAAAEVAHITDDAAREEQQDQAITRRAHQAGDHQWCDVTCEDNLPSEMLRNTILYRAIPGSKGALAELERRAAARARTAALREAADLAHAEGNRLYDDSGQRHAQGAWAVRDALRARADETGTASAGGEQA